MGLLLKFVSPFGIKVTHFQTSTLSIIFLNDREQNSKNLCASNGKIRFLKIFFVPENVDIVNTGRCLCFLFFPQLVWTLYCDIVCLDYDGNVTDACVLSLLAALNNS